MCKYLLLIVFLKSLIVQAADEENFSFNPNYDDEMDATHPEPTFYTPEELRELAQDWAGLANAAPEIERAPKARSPQKQVLLDAGFSLDERNSAFRKISPEEKSRAFRKSFKDYLNRPAKSWRMTPIEIMKVMKEITLWMAPLEEELKLSWLPPDIARKKAIEGLESTIFFLERKHKLAIDYPSKLIIDLIKDHARVLIKRYNKNTDTKTDFIFELQDVLRPVIARISGRFADFKPEKYFHSVLLFNRYKAAIKINEATGVVSQFFAQNNLELPNTPEYRVLRALIDQFYEKIIENLIGGVKFLTSLKDDRSLYMARQNKLIVAELAMARKNRDLAIAMCEELCLDEKSSIKQQITGAFYLAQLGKTFFNPGVNEYQGYRWLLKQKHTPAWIRNRALVALGKFPKVSPYPSHWLNKGPLTHEPDLKEYGIIQDTIDKQVRREGEAAKKRQIYLSSLKARPLFDQGSKFLTLEQKSAQLLVDGDNAESSPKNKELTLVHQEHSLSFVELNALSLTRMVSREEAEMSLVLESTADPRQYEKNREMEADYLKFYGVETKYVDLPVDEAQMEIDVYNEGYFNDPCIGPKTTKKPVQAEPDFDVEQAAALKEANALLGNLYKGDNFDRDDDLKADFSIEVQRLPVELYSLLMDHRLAEILFSFAPDENFTPPTKVINGLSDLLKNLDQQFEALEGGATKNLFLLMPNAGQQLLEEEINLQDLRAQLIAAIIDIYHLPKVPKDAFFALAQRYPEQFKSVSFATFYKYSAGIKNALYDAFEAKYKNLYKTLYADRIKIELQIAKLHQENLSMNNRLQIMMQHYESILAKIGNYDEVPPYLKSLWLRVRFEMAKLNLVVDEVNPQVPTFDYPQRKEQGLRKWFESVKHNDFASPSLKLKAKFTLLELDRRSGLFDQAPGRLRLMRKYEKMISKKCPSSLVSEVMLALSELYIKEAMSSTNPMVYFTKAFNNYQIILTNALPRLSIKLKARVGLALLERLEPSFKNMKNVEKSAEARLARTDRVLEGLQTLKGIFNYLPDEMDNIFLGTDIKGVRTMPDLNSSDAHNLEDERQQLEQILADADFCPYRVDEVRLWLAKINYVGFANVKKNHLKSFYLFQQIIGDRLAKPSVKASALIWLARLFLFADFKNMQAAHEYLLLVISNNDALTADKILAQKYLEKMDSRGCLKRTIEREESERASKKFKTDY